MSEGERRRITREALGRNQQHRPRTAARAPPGRTSRPSNRAHGAMSKAEEQRELDALRQQVSKVHMGRNGMTWLPRTPPHSAAASRFGAGGARPCQN